jgi:putative ABC transport system ATP-binding protein
MSATQSPGDPDRPSQREAVFQAQGLTKVYQMGEVPVHALRGIDLDLYGSELAALLGPSGSGKSTLLNILGGLDTPSAGSVTYRGTNLTLVSERELTAYRRRHVGFVFQFYNLIPSLTALENVAVVTEIADSPMDPREALDVVDLSERLNHFPSQLSGGEQQRVAIARAIAKNPSVLLCDEPTGWNVSIVNSAQRRSSSRTMPTSRAWPIASSGWQTVVSRKSLAIASECPRTNCAGKRHARTQSKVVAGSLGHAQPGAGDLHGDCCRRGDLRDVDQHAGGTQTDARHLLPGLPLC